MIDNKNIVSIVMASFQRADLLRYGLASIVRYKPTFAFEVVVVNDGLANDGTEEVCNEFKSELNIHYHFTGQRNINGIIRRNPAIPNNYAIRQAKGDIVILTCPEIVHRNNAIEIFVNVLREQKKAIVIPENMFFDFDGKYTKSIKNGERGSNNLLTKRNDHVKMPFLFGIWKNHIEEIRGYDEEFVGIGQEDCDFVNRLLLKGCSFVKTSAQIIHLHHNNHSYGFANWENPLWEYNNRLFNERKNIIVRNKDREWGTNQYIDTVIKNKSIEQIFTDIYVSNYWIKEECESVSGTGSSLQATESQRKYIPALFNKYKIKRVLDVGCGDVNWMQQLFPIFSFYLGIDVVKPLIETNTEKFKSNENVHFLHSEVTAIKNIDKYNFDVVILSDVLVHLSFAEINHILDFLRKTNIKYLFITNYTQAKGNNLIISGKWRQLNMMKYPFFFKQPIDSILIEDEYDFKVRGKKDKTLSLWKLNDELNTINKIPKVCHLFWESRPMSYLQTLTITTFHKQNPDWDILIYTPIQKDTCTVRYVAEYKGVDYFHTVRNLPYVHIINVDISDYGINEKLHNILRSDILRYNLLYNIGGVWSDFDVLWLRPIEKLFELKSLGKVTTKDFGTFVCRNKWNTEFNNISILISARKHPLYKKLIDTCMKIQDDCKNTDTLQHQAFGTTMLDNLWQTAQQTIEEFNDVVAFPYYTFYPYSIFKLEELYKQTKVEKALQPETIALHWWFGHKYSKEYVNGENKEDCSMRRIVELINKGIL